MADRVTDNFGRLVSNNTGEIRDMLRDALRTPATKPESMPEAPQPGGDGTQQPQVANIAQQLQSVDTGIQQEVEQLQKIFDSLEKGREELRQIMGGRKAAPSKDASDTTSATAGLVQKNANTGGGSRLQPDQALQNVYVTGIKDSRPLVVGWGNLFRRSEKRNDGIHVQDQTLTSKIEELTSSLNELQSTMKDGFSPRSQERSVASAAKNAVMDRRPNVTASLGRAELRTAPLPTIPTVPTTSVAESSAGGRGHGGGGADEDGLGSGGGDGRGRVGGRRHGGLIARDTGIFALTAAMGEFSMMSHLMEGMAGQGMIFSQEMRQIAFQTQGITGATHDLQNQWEETGDVVAMTGKTLSTFQKILPDLLKKGIRGRADENALLKTSLALSTRIGSDAGDTASTFHDMHMSLGLSNIQMSEMARSIEETARDTGVTGENLMTAVKTSERFMKNMRNASTYTSSAAANMTEFQAAAQKNDVGEEAAEINDAISSSTGFLMRASPQMQSLLASATSFSGRTDQLTYGTLGQSKGGMKDLAAGLDQMIQSMGVKGGVKGLGNMSQEQAVSTNVALKNAYGMESGQIAKIYDSLIEGSKTFGDKVADVNKQLQSTNLTMDERVTLEKKVQGLQTDAGLELLTQFDEAAKAGGTATQAATAAVGKGTPQDVAKRQADLGSMGVDTSTGSLQEVTSAAQMVAKNLKSAGGRDFSMDIQKAIADGSVPAIRKVIQQMGDERARLQTKEATSTDPLTKSQMIIAQVNEKLRKVNDHLIRTTMDLVGAEGLLAARLALFGLNISASGSVLRNFISNLRGSMASRYGGGREGGRSASLVVQQISTATNRHIRNVGETVRRTARSATGTAAGGMRGGARRANRAIQSTLEGMYIGWAKKGKLATQALEGIGTRFSKLQADFDTSIRSRQKRIDKTLDDVNKSWMKHGMPMFAKQYANWIKLTNPRAIRPTARDQVKRTAERSIMQGLSRSFNRNVNAGRIQVRQFGRGLEHDPSLFGPRVKGDREFSDRSFRAAQAIRPVTQALRHPVDTTRRVMSGTKQYAQAFGKEFNSRLKQNLVGGYKQVRQLRRGFSYTGQRARVSESRGDQLYNDRMFRTGRVARAMVSPSSINRGVRRGLYNTARLYRGRAQGPSETGAPAIPGIATKIKGLFVRTSPKPAGAGASPAVAAAERVIAKPSSVAGVVSKLAHPTQWGGMLHGGISGLRAAAGQQKAQLAVDKKNEAIAAIDDPVEATNALTQAINTATAAINEAIKVMGGKGKTSPDKAAGGALGKLEGQATQKGEQMLFDLAKAKDPTGLLGKAEGMLQGPATQAVAKGGAASLEEAATGGLASAAESGGVSAAADLAGGGVAAATGDAALATADAAAVGGLDAALGPLAIIAVAAQAAFGGIKANLEAGTKAAEIFGVAQDQVTDAQKSAARGAATVTGALNALTFGFFDGVLGVTGTWTKAIAEVISKSSFLTGVAKTFNFVIDFIEGIVVGAWKFIKNVFSGIWEGVKAAFSPILKLFDDVTDEVGVAIKPLTDIFGKLFSSAAGTTDTMTIVSKAIGGLGTALGTVLKWVGELAGVLIGVAATVTKYLITPVIEAVKLIAKVLATVINGVIDGITWVRKKLPHWAGGFADGEEQGSGKMADVSGDIDRAANAAAAKAVAATDTGTQDATAAAGTAATNAAVPVPTPVMPAAVVPTAYTPATVVPTVYAPAPVMPSAVMPAPIAQTAAAAVMPSATASAPTVASPSDQASVAMAQTNDLLKTVQASFDQMTATLSKLTASTASGPASALGIGGAGAKLSDSIQQIAGFVIDGVVDPLNKAFGPNYVGQVGTAVNQLQNIVAVLQNVSGAIGYMNQALVPFTMRGTNASGTLDPSIVDGIIKATPQLKSGMSAIASFVQDGVVAPVSQMAGPEQIAAAADTLGKMSLVLQNAFQALDFFAKGLLPMATPGKNAAIDPALTVRIAAATPLIKSGLAAVADLVQNGIVVPIDNGLAKAGDLERTAATLTAMTNVLVGTFQALDFFAKGLLPMATPGKNAAADPALTTRIAAATPLIKSGLESIADLVQNGIVVPIGNHFSKPDDLDNASKNLFKMNEVMQYAFQALDFFAKGLLPMATPGKNASTDPALTTRITAATPLIRTSLSSIADLVQNGIVGPVVDKFSKTDDLDKASKNLFKMNEVMQYTFQALDFFAKGLLPMATPGKNAAIDPALTTRIDAATPMIKNTIQTVAGMVEDGIVTPIGEHFKNTGLLEGASKTLSKLKDVLVGTFEALDFFAKGLLPMATPGKNAIADPALTTRIAAATPLITSSLEAVAGFVEQGIVEPISKRFVDTKGIDDAVAKLSKVGQALAAAGNTFSTFAMLIDPLTKNLGDQWSKHTELDKVSENIPALGAALQNIFELLGTKVIDSLEKNFPVLGKLTTASWVLEKLPNVLTATTGAIDAVAAVKAPDAAKIALIQSNSKAMTDAVSGIADFLNNGILGPVGKNFATPQDLQKLIVAATAMRFVGAVVSQFAASAKVLIDTLLPMAQGKGKGDLSKLDELKKYMPIMEERFAEVVDFIHDGIVVPVNEGFKNIDELSDAAKRMAFVSQIMTDTENVLDILQYSLLGLVDSKFSQGAQATASTLLASTKLFGNFFDSMTTLLQSGIVDPISKSFALAGIAQDRLKRFTDLMTNLPGFLQTLGNTINPLIQDTSGSMFSFYKSIASDATKNASKFGEYFGGTVDSLDQYILKPMSNIDISAENLPLKKAQALIDLIGGVAGLTDQVGQKLAWLTGTWKTGVVSSTSHSIENAKIAKEFGDSFRLLADALRTGVIDPINSINVSPDGLQTKKIAALIDMLPTAAGLVTKVNENVGWLVDSYKKTPVTDQAKASAAKFGAAFNDVVTSLAAGIVVPANNLPSEKDLQSIIARIGDTIQVMDLTHKAADKLIDSATAMSTGDFVTKADAIKAQMIAAMTGIASIVNDGLVKPISQNISAGPLRDSVKSLDAVATLLTEISGVLDKVDSIISKLGTRRPMDIASAVSNINGIAAAVSGINLPTATNGALAVSGLPTGVATGTAIGTTAGTAGTAAAAGGTFRPEDHPYAYQSVGDLMAQERMMANGGFRSTTTAPSIDPAFAARQQAFLAQMYAPTPTTLATTAVPTVNTGTTPPMTTTATGAAAGAANGPGRNRLMDWGGTQALDPVTGYPLPPVVPPVPTAPTVTTGPVTVSKPGSNLPATHPTVSAVAPVAPKSATETMLDQVTAGAIAQTASGITGQPNLAPSAVQPHGRRLFPHTPTPGGSQVASTSDAPSAADAAVAAAVPTESLNRVQISGQDVTATGRAHIGTDRKGGRESPMEVALQDITDSLDNELSSKYGVTSYQINGSGIKLNPAGPDDYDYSYSGKIVTPMLGKAADAAMPPVSAGTQLTPSVRVADDALGSLTGNNISVQSPTPATPESRLTSLPTGTEPSPATNAGTEASQAAVNVAATGRVGEIGIPSDRRGTTPQTVSADSTFMSPVPTSDMGQRVEQERVGVSDPGRQAAAKDMNRTADAAEDSVSVLREILKTQQAILSALRPVGNPISSDPGRRADTRVNSRIPAAANTGLWQDGMVSKDPARNVVATGLA